MPSGPGTQEGDIELMEIYAYAAACSGGRDGTVNIPFDEVGAFRPGVWRRWPAGDPVMMTGQPLLGMEHRVYRLS
jgi:hypothetical protein